MTSMSFRNGSKNIDTTYISAAFEQTDQLGDFAEDPQIFL